MFWCDDFCTCTDSRKCTISYVNNYGFTGICMNYKTKKTSLNRGELPLTCCRECFLPRQSTAWRIWTGQRADCCDWKPPTASKVISTCLCVLFGQAVELFGDYYSNIYCACSAIVWAHLEHVRSIYRDKTRVRLRVFVHEYKLCQTLICMCI